MQKRNTWLECEERNRFQAAVFMSENDRVAQLIIKEIERTQAGKEEGLKYPAVVNKACKMREVTFDKEVLGRLLEFQESKRRQVEIGLRPLVIETANIYNRQSSSISHAQKLRQL